VKVKRVTIRGLGGVQASSDIPPQCNVGIEFMGLNVGSFGGGKQKSNSTLGVSSPAIVSLRPDPKSQAAQYQPSTGSSIFVIRAVQQGSTPIIGAIIDVDVVFRNNADVNPAAVSVARAGLTPGDLYFGGLDGNPLATTQARSAFVRRA